jgi:hypothetical protein
MTIKKNILFLILNNCSCSNNYSKREITLKEKEIAKKERELQFKEDSLNRYSEKLNLSQVIINAENMFSKYLPTIEKSHN